MKKSNLEKAIIMGVMLSTGLYGTTIVEATHIESPSSGITIQEGKTSNEANDSVFKITGTGIIGAQGQQSGSYEYTLTNTGEIVIERTEGFKFKKDNSGEDISSNNYYYNDGISIAGGTQANSIVTIEAEGLTIRKTGEYNTIYNGKPGTESDKEYAASEILAGVSLNNKFTQAQDSKYVKLDAKLSSKNFVVENYDRGVQLGQNSKLDVTAAGIILDAGTAKATNENRFSNAGIYQNGKKESVSGISEAESEVNFTTTGSGEAGNIVIKNYANGIYYKGTGNKTTFNSSNDIRIVGYTGSGEDANKITGANGISIESAPKDSENNISLTAKNDIIITRYNTGITLTAEDTKVNSNKIYLKAESSGSPTIDNKHGIIIADVGTGIWNSGGNTEVKLESKFNYISAKNSFNNSSGTQTSGKGIIVQQNGLVNMISSGVGLTSVNGNQILADVMAIDANTASINVVANNSQNSISTTGKGSTAISSDTGNVLVQGSKNIISAGMSVDSGMFKEGIAIDAKKTESGGEASKVNVIAVGNQGNNEISGIVKADGGSVVNIGGGNFYNKSDGNLLGADYNQIISAGSVDKTATAIYSVSGSNINIKAAQNGSYNKNFITTQKAKDIDNAPTDEKTIWIKNSKVNIEGYENHISAGGEFEIAGNGYNYKEHYSGTAIDINSDNSTESTITISANGQNIIGGAVVASGDKASIDITNTGNSATRADSFIGNNITSAKNDNGSITAISATNQATVNVTADKAVNYIKAFSNDVDNNKTAKKVAISANDSTVNVSGLQNIIVAGDNREGMIVDANTNDKTTVTISSSLGSNLSGGLKAVGENNTIKIEGLSNAGNGTNQIISSAEVDTDVISAIYVKDKAQININDAKNNNFIATVSSDGQKFQKAVVVDNTTTTITGKNNTIAAGLTEKESKGISNFEDTYKGVALDVNNKGKLDILVGAKEGVNAISGSVNIKDSTLNIGGTSSDGSVAGLGSNQIISANIVDNNLTAISVDKTSALNIQADKKTGKNYILASQNPDTPQDITPKADVQIKAIATTGGTVNLGGNENYIAAGNSGEGLAIEATAGTNAEVTADTQNTIYGAISAAGENTKVTITGRPFSWDTYGSDDSNTITVQKGSNQIISSAMVTSDSGSAVSAIVAKDKGSVNIQSGFNAPWEKPEAYDRNYIEAKATDDKTIQKAVVADNGTVNIAGYTNFIKTGNGTGIALESSNNTKGNSTIDVYALDNNIISGAVVATGEKNHVNINASDEEIVITRSFRSLNNNRVQNDELHSSNQIISSAMIDTGKDTEKIIGAVVAKNKASVDLNAGTDSRYTSINYIAAVDNTVAKDGTTYEKRAVWADDATIDLVGYNNTVIAGSNNGEGVGLKASNTSKVSASAENINTIMGAVIAEGSSNIDIGYKKAEPVPTAVDVYEEDTELKHSHNNNIVSSYVVGKLKSAGDSSVEHDVVSAVYAKDSSTVNIKGDENIIQTIAGESDKEYAVLAADGTINIEGKTTIITSNGDVNKPNNIGIAIVAGTASKLDSVSTQADVTSKVNAKLDSESAIVGDIIAARNGQVDLIKSSDTVENINVHGNILAANGGVLNVDLGKSVVFTGRVDSYMDAQTNKDHGSNFFAPEFSEEITSQGSVDMKLGEKSRWNVTGQSWINSLTVGDGTTIDMTSADNNKNTSAGALTIGTFNGNATINMHLDDQDKYAGDMIYIKNGEGQLDVVIDNAIDQEEIGSTGLRFATVGKGSKIDINSVVAKNTGAFDVEYKVEKEKYDKNDEENSKYNGGEFNDKKPGDDNVNNFFDGVTTLDAVADENVNDDTTNFKIAGVGEIKINNIGKTIINLSAANYNNAVFMDSMNNRRGEARYLEGNEGFWVRMGHTSIGKSAFEINNNVYQLGYDKLYGASKGERRIGVVADYMTGDTSYKDVAASGKVSRKGLWLYNTWIGNDGHYTDLVAKWGHLDNNFDLFVPDHEVKGDYTNDVFSVSGEFGYKKDLGKDWYIEPQVQMQYAYITGGDYNTNQDTKVKADDMNSLIARAGFRIGKEIENKTTVYIKADVVHEFLGDLTMHTLDNTGAINDTFENSGTWYNVGLGVATMLKDNTYAYVSYERSFGNDNTNTYQVNGGVRWAF